MAPEDMQITNRNRNGRTFVAALLILLALVVLFSLGFMRNPFQEIHFGGQLMDEPAPTFILKDLDGVPRSLEDFRGTYIFMMFGYLKCKQRCQSQALELYALSRKIKDDNVRFLYISMDPLRDTVDALRHYFEGEDQRLVALRSDNVKQVQAIANQYHVPFSVSGPTQGEYEINHPGYVFLINPEGQLAILYTASAVDAELLNRDLEQYRRISESRI